MKNVSKQNKNTLAGNNLFVEIGKKISYTEVPFESKADILSNLLPEYVGMKRVRIIMDKFKEVEKLKSEVIVHWKDGKIYSICNGEDNKPCFVEVKTNIADVKEQVLSIVSEYLAPEDVDEFLQKYLLAIAETTAFNDEIETFALEVKETLEQLKTNEVLNLDKKLRTLVDKRIEHCNNITASYDCTKQIRALIEELDELIIQIAGENVIEKKYNELINFITEISKAISKLTLAEADYDNITDTFGYSIDSTLEYLNVVPDFIPKGYAYLDGRVQSNNFRIYDTRYRRADKRVSFIMTWISGRKLKDGTFVKGFFVSYAAQSIPPYSEVSTGFTEKYETFDEVVENLEGQTKLSWRIGHVLDRQRLASEKENFPEAQGFISENQYKAISMLNAEIDRDVVKLWAAWIIPRKKEEAFKEENHKLIEEKNGDFIITSCPEDGWKDARHALYLVIDR